MDNTMNKTTIRGTLAVKRFVQEDGLGPVQFTIGQTRIAASALDPDVLAKLKAFAQNGQSSEGKGVRIIWCGPVECLAETRSVVSDSGSVNQYATRIDAESLKPWNDPALADIEAMFN